MNPLLPHLHHIIQTVEDVLSCLLRLDSHLGLVLRRCLQKKEPQRDFSTCAVNTPVIQSLRHF